MILVGGAAAAAFVLVVGLGGDPAVAGAVAVLAAAGQPAILAGRRRAASERTADRWPDFLSALRGDLAGGSPVPEAAIAAGRRIGGRFTDLADQLAEAQATGRSFADAAASAQDRWADPLADRVLTTLAAAATTGGHRVSDVLASLTASVADELRLRRSHHAALTQQRLTAAVALIAPWALLVLTTATNPQAAAALSAPTGRLIVVGGLAATGLGYALARRAARLARPPRVFR
jgi:tight adherence protein B